MPLDSVFDAPAVDVTLKPLPADKCPDGSVMTGSSVLARTDAYEVGVWVHEAGRSTDVETDEVFVVVSGRGRVILDDGTVLTLEPGTVGVLYAGTRTTWEVDEPLRKVWIVER